jgi:hypothetical protein
MNQDQVKERLLELDPKVDNFTLIFTGKTSKKVDGLYYPDRCEIIIHNKNFSDDNQLMYTAIHEFAHHLHHSRSSVPVSNRAHTIQFWDIFHKLLFLAEEKGIHNNIFKKDKRFLDLTSKIKKNYLMANAQIMKDLGGLLEEADVLCHELNACFDDYVDRELLLHRGTAKLLMKIKSMNINPQIGYENMKTVAAIRDDTAREHAEEAFSEGMTPDMVRAEFAARNKPDGSMTQLLEERDKIERSIDTLTKKLVKIERRINDLKYEENPRRKK